MATLASLRILLGLDSGDVSKGAGRVRGELKGVQVEANKTRDAFTGIKQGIAAGFGLGGGIAAFNLASQGARELTEFIGDSITRASALNETLSKSAVIFGEDAAAVEAWGRTAATAFGQSTGQAIEARATLGNLFKTMGLGQADVLGMSENIVELASDLASFNNIGVDEALEKLRSGLVGQAEPLRTLGVQLTEANVRAKAMALGLVEANGALSESAKVQARYALILEQTTTAQGDFGRTSEGLANSQRSLGAEFANLSTEIGALVTGPVTDLIKGLRDLIPVLREAAGAAGDFGREVLDLVDPSEEFLNANQRNLLSAENIGAAFGRQEVRAVALANATNISAEALAAWTGKEQAATEAAAAANPVVKSLTENISDLDKAAVGAIQGANDLAAGVGAIGDAAAHASIDITTLMGKLQGLGGVPGLAEKLAGAGDTPMDTASAQFTLDQLERERLALAEAARLRSQFASDGRRDAERNAAEGRRLAEEAARQAERDAADAQRAKEEMWRAAQEAADRYFDRVHRQNNDAIDDIRDRRNAELDAQNAALQGPVDAERQRLDAIRDAERETGLRNAVATAETPGDLLAAQRDLQRFLEDERVEFMQGQADAGKALNEAARENANAAADMALAAEALRDIAARERFDPRVTRSADGSVARLDVADFINDAPIVVNLFIDGEQITQVVDRRLDTRRTNISPTSVSTGSAR